MAKFTLTNAFVLVNGVTLSDHGNAITVEDNRDQIDFTAFGATAKAYGKGLGDAKITVGFFQDFAGGSVHQTLQPLINGTTPFTIEVRADAGARSATNPGIVMSALLFSYGAIQGGIGEASTMTAEFVNAGAGITYPTS